MGSFASWVLGICSFGAEVLCFRGCGLCGIWHFGREVLFLLNIGRGQGWGLGLSIDRVPGFGLKEMVFFLVQVLLV